MFSEVYLSTELPVYLNFENEAVILEDSFSQEDQKQSSP